MWSKHLNARQRLIDEPIAWLTTVSAGGVPSTAPVWFFLEEDDTISISSKDPSARVRNLRENEHVTLHLEGDGAGGRIMVLSGTAQIDDEAPPISSHRAYIAKYQPFLDRYGWTPTWFAENYPTRIHMTVTSIRD